MPEHWILQLSGIGKGKLEELARMGISDILTIPGSFDLKGIPARIRKCVVNQTEYVGPDLKSKLIERQFPIHFLDFETISPAIPRYANTRPYQTLPFQWSDHILSKEGSLDHKEYLCTEDKDPREEVARALLDTLGGDKGDICNYANYEKKVISDLANHLPKYKDELETLADRCWDLCATIRKNYYHPEFHGSFSLKKVLPAVVSSMSFTDLAIQEGEQAGVEYLRMIDPETPPDEKERIHKALLEYCGQDTLGMVKIWEELLKRYKV
ncbi:MAG: DUF2779 domain-containing protein [candidate division Zixibacteria bacterium]|nr:DUF2779 domain-containing protein [candidate division Zixibacteria bacterium]